MKSINAVVRFLLADKLDRDVSAIRSRQDLEELGLRPLDLVLIALEVEELAGVHVPIHELASVCTVGELISFLSRSVVRESGGCSAAAPS